MWRVWRQVEHLIGANWHHRGPGVQESVALDNGAQFVKVPPIHFHPEVVAMAALEDVNTQFGEMVLMGFLAPAAWLHSVGSSAEYANKNSTNCPRHAR